MVQNSLSFFNTKVLKKSSLSKYVILCLFVLFFPGLMYYGLDSISLFLSKFNIYPPIPSGDYIVYITVQVCVYILLAIGLNIVCGYTGLLDLGYVGFYLIGGYTVGLLMVRQGFSYWLALPIAIIHGAGWGLLRGAPTLRLTGDYFAIVTFGFAEFLRIAVKNEIWLIGDINGFVKEIPSVTIPFTGIELKENWHHYYHILILIAVVIFVSYRLQHSRVGRAWIAIREDEQAAASMGINISRYKSLAFAISAALGAIGGGFLAQFWGDLSAKTFEFWESILILCMVILGGKGSIKGSIIGAIFIGFLGEILRFIPDQFDLPELAGARYLVYGIILVLLMRFRPDGLIFKKSA